MAKECIKVETLLMGTIGTLLFADDMVMMARSSAAQCAWDEYSTDQKGPKRKLEEVESNDL